MCLEVVQLEGDAVLVRDCDGVPVIIDLRRGAGNGDGLASADTTTTATTTINCKMFEGWQGPCSDPVSASVEFLGSIVLV